MSDGSYQFSGSLPPEAQTYVTRRADRLLFEKARSGKFCYVLSSRQMGKSSLRVRTIQKLREQGVVCGEIDLLEVCSQDIQKEEWYATIADNLVENFGLSSNFDLAEYWQEARQHFTTPDTILLNFLTDVVLPDVTGHIVIFVDEIDSILGLGFSVEEFFGLICQCNELQAEQSELGRLSWVLLGVARPEQLCSHSNLELFKLGQKIQLTGFRLDECDVLLEGLRERTPQPEKIMEAILEWTGGQPFLTQKLCQLVAEYPHPLEGDREANIVQNLVEKYILHDWERQDRPEHLGPIRNRLIERKKQSPQLLELYDRLLNYGEIPIDRSSDELELSSDEMELYLSGLAVPERLGDRYPSPVLRTCNRIYSRIFNKTWLQKQGISAKKYPPLPPIHPGREAQIIHDHFLQCVQEESPEVVFGRFRSLFIACVGYHKPDVEFTLRRFILICPNLKAFNTFFNRCCLILVHNWNSDRQNRSTNLDLLNLLEKRSQWNSNGSKFAKKMHSWMQEFTQSPEFYQLKKKVYRTSGDENHTISKIQYIYHNPLCYPLLYDRDRSFKDEIERQEYEAEIERQKNERKWQIRLGLQRCVRALLQQHQNDLDRQIYLSSINPTLLPDRELFSALKYCLDRSFKQPYITQRIAQRLRQELINTKPNSEKLKALLIEYLAPSVTTKNYLDKEQIDYIETTFKNLLEEYLEKLDRDRNDNQSQEYWLWRTCLDLINFLVATPNKTITQNQFNRDFLKSCSPIFLTETVVKLILLPPYDTKRYLEKNLENIFKYYEKKQGNQISWLIPFFEMIIIELTIYLGELDFSDSYLSQQ